jgi:hypothetical protein
MAYSHPHLDSPEETRVANHRLQIRNARIRK